MARFTVLIWLLLTISASCLAVTPGGSPVDPLWLREMMSREAEESQADIQLLGEDSSERSCEAGCGSYGVDTIFEMHKLLTGSGSDQLDPRRLESKLLLMLPLMGRHNTSQLIFRPRFDIYSTYAKRIALRPLRRMQPVSAPPGWIAIDTHVHTSYSHDSLADVSSQLVTAAHRGLAGIAITDHNAFEGCRVAENVVSKLVREGRLPETFFVIPGEEVSSSQGHIIALYIHHWIQPGLTAEKTLEEIHAQGGLAIAAHPEIEHSLGNLAVSLPFDAVEVHNAAEEMHYVMAKLSERDRRARFYAGVTKPRIGSSDAHDPETIATCYTLVNCAADPDEVRRAITQGLTQAIIHITPEEERAITHNRFSHLLLGAESVKDPTGSQGKSSRAPSMGISPWPRPLVEWRWVY